MEQNPFSSLDDINRMFVIKGRKHGLAAELAADEVIRLSLETARLQRKCEHLLQQAQIQAQEARTQRNTVYRIYEALGIREGDWNGAVPVIALFEKLVDINASLAEKPVKENLAWCTREELQEISELHCHGISAKRAIDNNELLEEIACYLKCKPNRECLLSALGQLFMKSAPHGAPSKP